MHIAHETAGAARIRSSLRPLFFRRANEMQNFGQIMPREQSLLSSLRTQGPIPRDLSVRRVADILPKGTAAAYGSLRSQGRRVWEPHHAMTPRPSHPPVVDPVLARQHALRAHGLDGDVAGQRQRSGEMIDAALLPRSALHLPHAGAPRFAVALQGGRDARDVV